MRTISKSTTRRPTTIGSTLLLLVVGFVLSVFVGTTEVEAQGVFIRGDCDQSVVVDLSDAIKLLSYLFLGTDDPICLDACDTDDSGDLDISDAIKLLSYLFLGSAPPESPFPFEGIDPSEDTLTCLNGQLPFEELLVTPASLVLYRIDATIVLSVVGVNAEVGTVDVRTHPATRYESDDDAIASVDSAGVVTARGVGSTTIRVLHRGSEGRANVTVAEGADGSPVVKITSPGEGTIVSAPSVRLAGLVSDPSATLELSVNGSDPVALESSGGMFRVEIDLELGTSTFVIVAQGESGTGQAYVSVRRVEPGSEVAIDPSGDALPVVPAARVVPRDEVAPIVEITSPSSGANLRSALVTVEGTIDDPNAELRVGGLLATVDTESGTFRVDRLRVAAGATTITAVATDAVGNESTDSVEVEIESASPVITVDEPAFLRDGSDLRVSTSSSFEIRGTIEGAVGSVSINGEVAILTGHVFRLAVDRPDGVHAFRVTARTSGPMPALAQSSLSVVVDTSAPKIDVLFPPENLATSTPGFETGEETITIAGRLRDAGVPVELREAIELSVEGGEPILVRDTFAVEVPLEVGVNLIDLEAVDARGFESTLELRVVRSSVPLDRLVLDTGNGQSSPVNGFYGDSLTVRALSAGGALQQNFGVEFRILAGSGSFADGSRRTIVETDSFGIARISVRSGHEIGASSQIVAVSGAGGAEPENIFVLHTTRDSETQLVAHRGRERVGEAGGRLAEALGVRVVDRYGDPLEGETVLFRVTEGEMGLGEQRSTERDVFTDAGGLAAIDGFLPTGETVQRVEASYEGSIVEFEIRGLVPSAPLDTRIDGFVSDDRGVAVAGATVEVQGASAGSDGIVTTTGPRGEFALLAAPSGSVRVEVLPSDTHSGASREIFVVRGRRHTLSAPMRVASFADPSRSRRLRLWSGQGAVFTLTSLPGLRLHVEADAVTFPDGSREGVLHVSAPSSRILAGRVRDDVDARIPLMISPAGVRFDPPARLELPSPGLLGGRVVPLYGDDASDGLRQLGRGLVADDGLTIESFAGEGISRGGLHFFEGPGLSGGHVGRVDGQVTARLAGVADVPQRDDSAVGKTNVYLHSGEFFLEAEDLVLPGRGLSYRLSRRYESRHNFRGSLGWNWEHEYADRRLVRAPGSGNVVRNDGRGSRDEYVLDHSSGAFLSPIGVFSRLFTLEDDSLIERTPDGTRYHYAPLDDSLTSGKLMSITDRAGNALRMVYDPLGRLDVVVDTLQRRIRYVWRDDTILRVHDFTGREVEYSYDEDGNLESVRSPPITGTPNSNDFPLGRTTVYKYSSGFSDSRLNHNLIEWIEPREIAAGTRRPRLVNHYREDADAADVDRVISQDLGGVNDTGVLAGGTTTFAYLDVSPWPEDEVLAPSDLAAFLLSEVCVTEVTDARGVTTETTSSGAGLPLRIRVHTLDDGRPRDEQTLHPPPGVKPPFYETRLRWSREGLLEERTFPRGNRELFEYDVTSPMRYGRGNCVREVRLPFDESEPGHVTERAFEPLYQTVILDVPTGIDGAADPLRAIRRVMDYQEDSELPSLADEAGIDEGTLTKAFQRVGITLGLGDQNGDNLTSLRSGNVIREDVPVTTSAAGVRRGAARTFVYNFFGQLSISRDAEGVATLFEYHPERDPEGDGVATVVEGLDRDTGGFLHARTIDPEGLRDDDPLEIRETFLYDEYGNLSQHTDARGFATNFIYNAIGELLERNLGAPLRYRWQTRYDADGNVEATRYSNIRANDVNTHLIVSENLWVDSSFENDLLGQRVTETRESTVEDGGSVRSATTRFRYDGVGNRIRVIHPVEGTDDATEYDARGLVLAEVRAEGTLDEARIERRYDENGNLVLEIDAADSDEDGERETTEHRYDGHDRRVATVDAAAGTRVFVRDGTGAVVDEVFYDGERGLALLERTRRRFDERGREIERRRLLFDPSDPASDPRELVESFDVDAESRETRRTRADGSEVRILRDAAGRAKEEIDDRGLRTIRRFDGNGNLIFVRREVTSEDVIDLSAADDPDYDEFGRLIRAEQEVHVYDDLDRLILSVDPKGGTWRLRYDSADCRVLVSDSSAVAIGAEAEPDLEDVLDLLTPTQFARINGHGNIRRFAYDHFGRVRTAVAELRADGTGSSPIESTNGFNVDGLVTEHYDWDDNGRLIGYRDDLGRRTSFSWDRAGYLRGKVWHDESTETWQVDRDGNPMRYVDRRGSTFVQRFDGLHRVVEREVFPAEKLEGVGGTLRQSFEYDALGRLTLARDGADPDDDLDDVITTRSYDSCGRFVRECQGRFVFTFEYDDVGRLVRERYPDGREIVRERGPSGAQVSLRDGDGQVFSEFARFADGTLIDRQILDGTITSYLTADGDGVLRADRMDELGAELVLEHMSTEGASRYEFEYGRNARSDPIWQLKVHRDGIGDVWSYDSLYRIRAFYPSVFDPRVPPQDPLRKHVFLIDGNHNWRQIDLDQTVASITVGDMDQYRFFGAQQVQNGGTGNITEIAGLTFTYDAFDRVIAAHRGKVPVARYRYDAIGSEDAWSFRATGRRVRREVLTPVTAQPSGVTLYTYSHDGIGEERDELGDVLRQYYWEDGKTPRDRGRSSAYLNLAATRGEALASILHDALDSPIALVDRSGAVIEDIRYGPHGQRQTRDRDGRLLDWVDTGFALLYGGNVYDFETGLYSVGARLFLPDIGRFLTKHDAIVPPRAFGLNGYALTKLPGLPDTVSGTGSHLIPESFFAPFVVPLTSGHDSEGGRTR